MNRRPYMSSQPFDVEKQMERNRRTEFKKDLMSRTPYEILSVMISRVSTMIYNITNLQDLQAPKIPKVVKRGPMYYIPDIHKSLEYITIIWGILRETELFTGNDADISDKIEEMSIYFKELNDKNPEMLTEQEYTDMNTLYDRATTLQATLKEVQRKHKPINAIAPPVVSAPAPSTYTPYVSQTLTGGTRRKQMKRKQTQRKQRKQTQRKRKQRK